MRFLIIMASLTFLMNKEIEAQAQEIVIEQSAEFPGGIRKFYEYLGNSIKYPKAAKKNKAEGMVYVQFFITEDGSIDKDSIKIVPASLILYAFGSDRSKLITTERSLEEEAIRIVRNSPKWIPGTLRGVARRQKFTLPVNFVR